MSGILTDMQESWREASPDQRAAFLGWIDEGAPSATTIDEIVAEWEEPR